MIKIVIADDQTLLCQSLAKIIDSQEEFSVVAHAFNGKEVLEACEKYHPNIAILDIEMPEMSGLEALEQIKRNHKEIKVIMLTTFDNEESVYSAFLSQANAYITKDISPDELFVTIRAVSYGMTVMTEGLTEILLGICKQKSVASTIPIDNLDAEDLLMIKYVVEGKSNKSIATEIGYSEGTIKNRLTKIYDKLGINDRVALAVYALEHGIVE